jgi:hypothetical protein
MLFSPDDDLQCGAVLLRSGSWCSAEGCGRCDWRSEATAFQADI